MTAIFAPGPVAGSAMIVSLISYNGSMNICMTMDPAAIPDGGELRDRVAASYDELTEAARAHA
jgi:hypothetical protein